MDKITCILLELQTGCRETEEMPCKVTWKEIEPIDPEEVDRLLCKISCISICYTPTSPGLYGQTWEWTEIRVWAIVRAYMGGWQSY